MRDPRLAAVLRLIIPGVGQLYNGHTPSGVLWVIIKPGFWTGTGGTLAPTVNSYFWAYTAYSYARDHRVRA